MLMAPEKKFGTSGKWVGAFGVSVRREESFEVPTQVALGAEAQIPKGRFFSPNHSNELIFQVPLLIIRMNPYLYLTRVMAQSRPNKRFYLPRAGKLACGSSAISIPLQVFSKIYPPAVQFSSLRSANRPIVRLFPANNRTHKKDSRERVCVKT